jgi:hypothetical protein
LEDFSKEFYSKFPDGIIFFKEWIKENKFKDEFSWIKLFKIFVK